MSTTSTRHHITAFHAENVKKLRVVRLTPRPGGGLIEVSGANGSGKSSVLDAIAFALLGRGAVDPKPIREGEETAIVTLTLGDVTVTRKFQANGGSTVTVESAEGARFTSPQKMLDELVGSSVLTFDPLAFDRMKPAEQLEEVRKVAPLPDEVDKWRAEIAATFAARTDVNREAKALGARLQAAVIPDPIAPFRPVDELIREIEGAAQHNAELAKARAHRAGELRSITEERERSRKLRDDAERMLKEADALGASAENRDRVLSTMAEIEADRDVAEIRAELDASRQSEKRVEEARAIAKLDEEHTAKVAESEAMTKRIADLEAKVRDAVSRVTMPVDGLGYGEGGLEFRGIPLEQASGAERLRVALALAMAQRPGLRVVRIKDGSLLDEKSLAIVHDMAVREDFQVWIERVDTTGRVGIVLEDGEVVGVNGGVAEVPAREPGTEDAANGEA